MDEQKISKQQASQYVIKQIKITRINSLVGLGSIFTILLIQGIGIPSFVSVIISFPVLLYLAYTYMTSKKYEEELKIKYG